MSLELRMPRHAWLKIPTILILCRLAFDDWQQRAALLTAGMDFEELPGWYRSLLPSDTGCWRREASSWSSSYRVEQSSHRAELSQPRYVCRSRPALRFDSNEMLFVLSHISQHTKMVNDRSWSEHLLSFCIIQIIAITAISQIRPPWDCRLTTYSWQCNSHHCQKCIFSITITRSSLYTVDTGGTSAPIIVIHSDCFSCRWSYREWLHHRCPHQCDSHQGSSSQAKDEILGLTTLLLCPKLGLEPM